MTRIALVVLLSTLLPACGAPVSAMEPISDCAPDGFAPNLEEVDAVLLVDGGAGWTETYPASWADGDIDWFVAELDASGARGDFRVTALAYGADVELRVECASGLRTFSAGPDCWGEDAVADERSCAVDSRTVAIAVLGCSDPASPIRVTVGVRRVADACTYELEVSIVPETT